MRKLDDELSALAESIARKLIAEGFIVQRYGAYTTSSIYLKLDYGVCNSIRISDHPGKRYLKYRYNIGPSEKGSGRKKISTTVSITGQTKLRIC